MYNTKNIIEFFPELFMKDEIPEDIRIWLNLKMLEWEPGDFLLEFFEDDVGCGEKSLLHTVICQHIFSEVFEITLIAPYVDIDFPSEYNKRVYKLLYQKLMYKLDKRLLNKCNITFSLHDPWKLNYDVEYFKKEISLWSVKH